MRVLVVLHQNCILALRKEKKSFGSVNCAILFWVGRVTGNVTIYFGLRDVHDKSEMVNGIFAKNNTLPVSDIREVKNIKI